MWKSVAFVMILMPSLCWAAQKGPKPGTYYKYDQLGIQKKELKGTKLHLTFKPQDEQFHWCPGVKVQVTKKATIVTFIRCKTSQSCAIDTKAAIGKRLVRTVTIDTKGLDTYVFDGPKRYKRIHKAAKTKTNSKTSETKSSTKSSSRPVLKASPRAASPSQQPTRQWMFNEFALPN